MKRIIVIIILVVIVAVLVVVLYHGSGMEKEAIPADREVVFKPFSESNEYYEINAKKPTGNYADAEKVRLFVEDWVEDFKELAESEGPGLREIGFPHKHTLDILLSSHSSDDYFSYVLLIGEYTGGANVNHLVETFVFERRFGNEISITGVVSEDGLDEFLGKIRSELKAREDDYVFPGISEEITLDNIRSFYVTDEEITVLFSKYEVAPGAAGIVDISVPRSF